MPKLLALSENGQTTGYMIHCPGCDSTHSLNIKNDNPNGIGGRKPTWTFDGNLEKPTFSPSLLVKCNDPTHKYYQSQAASSVCHSFIRNGRIEFLTDSTHSLAGKTVDLPDIDTVGDV